MGFLSSGIIFRILVFFYILIYNVSQVVDSTGGHTVRECEPSSVAGSRLLVSGAATSHNTATVAAVTKTSAGTSSQPSLQTSPKLLSAKQSTVEPTTTSSSTAVPLLKVSQLLVFLEF